MIYIVLEGIDNAGKTTIATELESQISQNGYKVKISKELTTEVGKIVLQSFKKKERISPELKTYLFAADRLVRMEKLKHKKLDFVIWDRYIYSAMVYREMEGIDVEWVKSVNAIFKDPDLAYYIDIDPHESLRRGLHANKSCPYTIEELARCREIYKRYVDGGNLIEIRSQAIDMIIKKIMQDLEKYYEKRKS